MDWLNKLKEPRVRVKKHLEIGNVEKVNKKPDKARRSLAFILLDNVEKVLKRQEWFKKVKKDIKK